MQDLKSAENVFEDVPQYKKFNNYDIKNPMPSFIHKKTSRQKGKGRRIRKSHQKGGKRRQKRLKKKQRGGKRSKLGKNQSGGRRRYRLKGKGRKSIKRRKN